ncbi:MAG: restriction endonuclease [Burkholderiaceae bacterium]|nr:MAG: restriction endonuclease [Burkholderiaceae bacterium]
MNRRYRKSRREPGLIEIALTSDWKVSAGMSAFCVVGALVIVPVLFGGQPLLRGVAALVTPLAWMMATVFGCISLLRFSRQQAKNSLSSVGSGALRRTEPVSAAVNPPLSALDETLMPARSEKGMPLGVPERPTEWTREVIDRLEWKRFEDVCCEFYRIKGIRAETTDLGADGGVDIRLFQDDGDPGRCTAIVQCKAWSQAVGVKLIRELRGVMAHQSVEKGFFMVPNGFTDDARAFAAENRITLVDGRLFLAMLERLPETSRAELLAFATAGDWTTPTCPGCGTKMVARDSKRGPFWGCPSFPRCRSMLPMRATDKRTHSHGMEG